MRFLITGGTGSFGQAYAKHLLQSSDTNQVVIFSRDELKQWEMRESLGSDRMRFFLGDVRDEGRLVQAFQGVDVVIHAAALKQVVSAEYNPMEVIKTNILGSQNVISAAIKAKVGNVIAISTDKAVAPFNLYGGTKFCVEKLFTSAHVYAPNGPRFKVVRYGNVFGSRGSVLHVFKDQLGADKPITLTHKDMTRFMLTLDDACDIVARVLRQLGYPDAIYAPMLPAFRVIDLAYALAQMHAKSKGDNFTDFEYIGIRPGEKIHETLRLASEPCWYDRSIDMTIIHEHGEPTKADYTSNGPHFMTIGELADLCSKH